MSLLNKPLLIFCLFASSEAVAQLPAKQIAYFDARNVKLSSPKGAAYAVETEYQDSLRATERWYSAPQKVKEVGNFSNIGRRLREGETITYYPDGNIKRRTIYQQGRIRENYSYYSNHKLRHYFRLEKEKMTEQKCFAENGSVINCDTLIRQTKCTPSIPTCSVSGAVRYPTPALKAGAQGLVKVQFVVNRFGKLADVWIVESPSPLLNQEAMAAVRRMKKYCNQYIDCEAVDTIFTLPITFHIDK